MSGAVEKIAVFFASNPRAQFHVVSFIQEYYVDVGAQPTSADIVLSPLLIKPMFRLNLVPTRSHCLTRNLAKRENCLTQNIILSTSLAAGLCIAASA